MGKHAGRRRLCRYCRSEFQVTRDWQLFCRNECKTRWHRENHAHCFYCGELSRDRDHIFPHSARTNSKRRSFVFIETIDSCRECNVLISNYLSLSIEDRMNHLIDYFIKRHKLDAKKIEWSDVDFEELGPRLTRRIKSMIAKTKQAQERLWYMHAVLSMLSSDCVSDAGD